MARIDRFLKAILLAGFLAVAISAPAMAADQPATAPTPAAPATPAAKLFAQGYGDWIYRCVENAASASQPANTACSVQQSLILKQNGQTVPLLTLTFVKATKGHEINIMAPLGIALKAGIDLSLDDAKPVSAAFSFCTSGGCFVVGQAAYPITKGITAAKIGHAKIGLLNGKSLTINFSIKGLSAALAALDSGVPPTQQVVAH